MESKHEHSRVTYVTGHEEILPDLLRRLLLVLGLIALIAGLLWLDRDGLRDIAHPGRPLTFIDVLYFTMVTVTTVGYGDIAPETQFARLIGTFVVTPVRVFILILFIGTAYDLAIQRYKEAYQMRKVKERLQNHIILCGYGVKGRATVTELLSFGHRPEEIVVIESKAEVAADAASQGFVSFRGDATAEASLKAAAIDSARYVIVDVDRDDTTVLICLTAKHLNPDVCVVAAAKETENVPLIYRSGADSVVAGPVAGGRLLAIATQMRYVPRVVEDILTFGRGIDFGERVIQAEEAGTPINHIPDLAGRLVVGAYHRGQIYTFDRLSGLPLEPGDVVIYLTTKS